jgi:hypothetical protein
MFVAEYGVQIIIVLDDHAGAKLCGGDRHCWADLLKKYFAIAVTSAEGGQATFSTGYGDPTLYFTRA